jgi:hypothetical protein
MGNNFHLQWALMPPAPGNEGIEMPPDTNRGTSSSPTTPPLGSKQSGRWMEEVSLYLPSSGGTKTDQGQATELFPGDYYTTGP